MTRVHGRAEAFGERRGGDLVGPEPDRSGGGKASGVPGREHSAGGGAERASGAEGRREMVEPHGEVAERYVRPHGLRLKRIRDYATGIVAAPDTALD